MAFLMGREGKNFILSERSIVLVGGELITALVPLY
jgi:hypothetical protein